MHEQIIARNIITEAQKHGQVKSILLEVGDLAHLPAEEMLRVLEDLTDWKIEVVTKKALVLCEECRHLGPPVIVEHMHDHSIFKCMKCEKMFPKIEDGDQIVLKEVFVNE